MVGCSSLLARFFRDTVTIPRILGDFHDIRTRPRIRLRDILLCVFLMPFWSMSSLLQLDVHLRNPQMLRLFRCAGNKRVVVSDTTIARVLRWLAPADSRRALLNPVETLETERLLTRSLAPKSRARRLGVFDGSQMGSHYLVAALLCGKINCPVLAEPCPGRGHELKTTQYWLPRLHHQLGATAPQLWLLDAKYFNHSSFQTVRSLKAHLLIKYTPHDDPVETKLFRDVLDDAQRLFAADAKVIEPVESSSGFDPQRLCSWSMKKTSAEFAAFPVNIFLLVEDYPKRAGNAHVETWIVTTDLTLSFAEAREAAHLRWQIENNEFKRLSHLAGTKTVYFKDPRSFFSLLRLFCLALTVFDAFFYIVIHRSHDYQQLMQGCKFTWKSAFSQMRHRYPHALEYLVTATG